MKVLFLIPYPLHKAPSQRFRFEQYLSFFQQNGYQCIAEPFLSEATWNIFYKNGNHFKKAGGICKGFVNRIKLLFKIKEFDIIFIHREACFIGPAIFEWAYSLLSNRKIIFDFDDAIWLHDVSDANIALGWLKSPAKTATIIQKAGSIIAGNAYLAEYAKKFNQNTFIIPTTIDTNYHKPKAKGETKDYITLGWTGSSTTIKHFEEIIPVLKKIKNKYKEKVRILLISDKSLKSEAIGLEFITWNKETEIDDLSKIDVGIMPLPDDKWSKGKCGFKGLQYMALNIPTIMSPVGVNKEIIENRINGFLASTEEEWIEKLSLLIESQELREKIGKAGRQTVIERYSVESQKENYLAVFNSIAMNKVQHKQ